jgi:nucleotide-binding universal stress UspA family protein
MFARLLVPLDGTPEAATALPAATTLASIHGATITLVRVISDRHDNAAERQQAEVELRSAAETLDGPAVRVTALVQTGPAAALIVHAAEVSDADLIVMATHGRTGLSRALAGSVSERVVADSGRPVLVLKPDDKPLDRIATILVPVDGSVGALLGLSAAVGLARAAGARLILLDAVPPMPMWMYGEASIGAVAYFDPAWEQEALQSAETYVTGLGERLRKTGLQVETRAVRGEVAPTIQTVADETDADLVVMSTHALTGPARTVLGSVADAVVRTSLRPVLLVRRPGGRQDASVDESRDPSLAMV